MRTRATESEKENVAPLKNTEKKIKNKILSVRGKLENKERKEMRIRKGTKMVAARFSSASPHCTGRFPFMLLLLCLLSVGPSVVGGQEAFQEDNEVEGEDIINNSGGSSSSIATPITMETSLPLEPSNKKKRKKTLIFLKGLKNMTKEAGDFLRLRCEVSGDVPATSLEWLKNGVPLIEEKNRMKIKTKLKENPQWTQLRIRALETLDTAFYQCQASNEYDTIDSQAVIKVNLGKVDLDRRPQWGSNSDDDDDYDESGLLPETYSEPDFPGMGRVEFEGGQKPPDMGGNNNNNNRFDNGNNGNRGGSNFGSSVPKLKPNERSGGNCEPYLGSVCAKYVGQSYVFVSEGLSQVYIEQKLQAAFTVISASPDLSQECSPYAIPSICLSTFPLCDRMTERPRKLCREECELLETRVCQKELVIAKQFAQLDRQLVLPECHELPALGTPESSNCVRLGLPAAQQLLRPHTCYVGNGEDFRGTVSTTETGLACLPWNRQSNLRAIDYLELTGGHNYCRNPSGVHQMDEPWCYASHDHNMYKEACAIPKCNNFNLYLYIAIPVLVAVALLGICIGICCMRRGRSSRKDSKPISAANTLPQAAGGPNAQGNMEMNSLLPQDNQQQQQQPQMQQQQTNQRPRPRLREFPLSSVRFMQELGEGAFGKVFKGELSSVGNNNALVAIKTLKPGATQKTRNDFQREAELMSDLRHPNIVCLLGVAFQEDPQCMFFEHMANGDLHEFLITHSPNIDSDISEPDEDQNVLSTMDMSFVAIQIAAGMEYLASHHYVHRDLAARNCLVGENLTVKISDFGLSRDIYAADYYRVQSKSLLPVRWMPPESILYGKFTTESDVWSFGVVLWEIYSYGLQPYYGYSNQEVIEMIRSRQLLPCPEDCPSRMYAFMVECWHEVPSRRPPFSEIHSRLRHWEGFGSGVYQPSTTSQSMGNQSQQSGSHHSSTGPSNNTGSTNLSQNHFLQQQQMMRGGGPPYMSHVQMGPHGGGQTMLVGAYGGQSMYHPQQPQQQQQQQPLQPPQQQHLTQAPASSVSSQNSNCQTPASVASLQMV